MGGSAFVRVSRRRTRACWGPRGRLSTRAAVARPAFCGTKPGADRSLDERASEPSCVDRTRRTRPSGTRWLCRRCIPRPAGAAIRLPTQGIAPKNHPTARARLSGLHSGFVCLLFAARGSLICRGSQPDCRSSWAASGFGPCNSLGGPLHACSAESAGNATGLKNELERKQHGY